MTMTLFADRFLVAPIGPEAPRPAGYDEVRSISVTADCQPFIEAGAMLATRTLTEAEGEASDDDEDRAPTAGSMDDQLLGTRTATFVDAEGLDTDEDRLATMALDTQTRARGEKSDAPPWAHTETAAPGEAPDYDPIGFLTTVTKAPGERGD